MTSNDLRLHQDQTSSCAQYGSHIYQRWYLHSWDTVFTSKLSQTHSHTDDTMATQVTIIIEMKKKMMVLVSLLEISSLQGCHNITYADFKLPDFTKIMMRFIHSNMVHCHTNKISKLLLVKCLLAGMDLQDLDHKGDDYLLFSVIETQWKYSAFNEYLPRMYTEMFERRSNYWLPLNTVSGCA